MKTQFLATCLICSTLINSFVHSASIDVRTDIPQYKSYFNSIQAHSDDGVSTYSVSGAVYDDLSGVVRTNLSVRSYNEVTQDFGYISCNYSEGEAVVAVEKINEGGFVSLRGTLDPSDPECTSSNIFGAIMIDLGGRATEDLYDSTRGRGRTTYHGNSWEYKHQKTQFSMTLNGRTSNMNGPWNGHGIIARNFDFKEIK